ncbi:MAG: histidine phosphatase family protein [Acidisphaera sp.]|nr:histidine phosphatase family protein [Acidisphaera sp.]
MNGDAGAERLRSLPFWFLRHGETDWNKQNVAQGNLEIPLNEHGIAQAHAAAEQLRGRNIATIVASPLSRARITAEIASAAIGVPVAFDPELHETSYGAMERQPMSGAWFVEWVYGRSTPEGAESFPDLQRRAVAAVNRALDQPSPVLIVGHGGFFRALRAAMGLERNVRAPNATPFWCEPGEPWRLTTAAGEPVA